MVVNQAYVPAQSIRDLFVQMVPLQPISLHISIAFTEKISH